MPSHTENAEMFERQRTTNKQMNISSPALYIVWPLLGPIVRMIACNLLLFFYSLAGSGETGVVALAWRVCSSSGGYVMHIMRKSKCQYLCCCFPLFLHSAERTVVRWFKFIIYIMMSVLRCAYAKWNELKWNKNKECKENKTTTRRRKKRIEK